MTRKPASASRPPKSRPWSTPPPAPCTTSTAGPSPTSAYSIGPDAVCATRAPALTRAHAARRSRWNCHAACPEYAAPAIPSASARERRGLMDAVAYERNAHSHEGETLCRRRALRARPRPLERGARRHGPARWRSCLLRDHPACVFDERARGGVGLLRKRRAVGECGDQRLGERLAQLDAPLVERIDAEEDALDERAVLVEREQCAEALRVERRQQERRGRAIARTCARTDRRLERFAGIALCGELWA